MTVKAGKNSQVAKPVYVICGKDKYLISGQCDSLVDKLLSTEERTMALYQPETDKAQITDVLDELRTLPFLAKRRVVVIKDADKFISENREHLEKYFEEPCTTGVLILVVNAWNKSTKLAKKLPSVGKLIGVDEIKPAQLSRYAGSYAREQCGKSLAPAAAELLVELVGDDAGRICREIDKLAIYVDQQNSIGTNDVEKLTGHNRMFNAFAVIDAMTTGNTAEAVERLRNMFAADKSAEFTVIGAFAFHFRRMFNAKSLLSKGLNQYQVSGKLRIWGNKEAFFGQIRRISLRQIGSMLAELGHIDNAVKTGQRDIKSAMEQMVLKMTAGV